MPLSESSAVFTVENAPIGIAHVDATGKFLYVNRAFAGIVGWSRQDLLKTTWQSITHPDDVDPDSDHVGALLCREREQYQMDKRYITESGQTVWVSLNVYAYFIGTEFQRFISIIEDITSRYNRLDHLEKQLNDAIFMVSELNREFANYDGCTV